MSTRACAAVGIAAGMIAWAAVAGAAPADSVHGGTRPFVAGGYDDKPHVDGLFGRIAVGGYVQAVGEWARVDGSTEALGVQVRRWNLLAATRLRDRVQVWSELEFEDGGDEVRVELAQVDVRITRAAHLRGGVLLLPLGRFNLAHDAPRLDLPDRPLLADHVLGVALSMPGMGGFGAVGAPERFRLTWEGYAVTGYHDGLLLASAEGTRLPAGRANHDDANASPAWVGRLEGSTGAGASAGVSAYRGAYNVYRQGGLDVDDRRDVRIAMLDAGFERRRYSVSGELAWIGVDLPPGLAGPFASRQLGGWLQTAVTLRRSLGSAFPDGSLRLCVRGDAVDFDRDRTGDSERAISIGLAVRPIPESVIQLAWVRGESRDRFDNVAAFARVQCALATYF